MSVKLFKAQTEFLLQLAGRVPSESVVEARVYRAERHCDKSEFSEKISQEYNNSKKLKCYRELDETFDKILESDKICCETKNECARKQNEVTQNMEPEQILNSKLLDGSYRSLENEKLKLRSQMNKKEKDLNIKEYSMRNQKSRNDSETTSMTSHSAYQPSENDDINTEKMKNEIEQKLRKKLYKIKIRTNEKSKMIEAQMIETSRAYEGYAKRARDVVKKAARKSEKLVDQLGELVSQSFLDFSINIIRSSEKLEESEKRPEKEDEQDQTKELEELVMQISPSSIYQVPDVFYSISEIMPLSDT